METENLDIYGSASIPWARACEALAASHGPGVTFFLGTVRPDATPHAAGIGAVWADDTLWFVTGPRTRKGLNFAAVAPLPRHVPHRVRRRDRSAARGFVLAVR